MLTYYNEFDPFAASWLRELQRAGEIPRGRVDDRSIADVRPDDVRGIDAHFFAGIGGWPYALRLAGWPLGRQVWTGSCPCQPFSTAGKRRGESDERHVWPEFRRLIAECRPATVFGEQVASPLGRDWIARVRRDLEALGYVVGIADLCAAGVGAPHIRQRLFWVAYTDGGQSRDGAVQRGGQHGFEPQDGDAVRVGDADDAGPQGRHVEQRGRADELAPWAAGVALSCTDGKTRRVEPVPRPDGVDDAHDAVSETKRGVQERGGVAAGGAWLPADLIPCTDGKTRRVEPGVFPLAHGVSARVGRLRGYGNAIVPQVAAAFVASFLDAEKDFLTSSCPRGAVPR